MTRSTEVKPDSNTCIQKSETPESRFKCSSQDKQDHLSDVDFPCSLHCSKKLGKLRENA